MAGVAEDGQRGIAAAEFYWNVPLRVVAVGGAVVQAEAPVDGGDAPYAREVKPLHGTYPQVDVRIDGVFDHHRDVVSPQRVSYLLHGEGVGSGARTYPQYVYADTQSLLYVFGTGHFRCYAHSRVPFDLFQPFEPFAAYALECVRASARLP